MKKSLKENGSKSYLLFLIAVLLTITAKAQFINSSSATRPFGQNIKYNYGNLPTNLPTGTYGNSEAAA